MMSGRPVLSTRLNGFSSNYDNLLIMVDNGEAATLAKMIDIVDGLPNVELQERADSAREYLINNKTWKDNAQMVYSFIREIAGLDSSRKKT